MRRHLVLALIVMLTCLWSSASTTGQVISVGQSKTERLSNSFLQEIASSITVNIQSSSSKKSLGSGTIVEVVPRTQDGRTYFIYQVLTNKHVLQHAKQYVITTNDGVTHQVLQDNKINFQKQDLALLWFRSYTPYRTTQQGNFKTLSLGSKLLSAGFACDESSCEHTLTITMGELAPVSFLKGKTFVKGYGVGYTNVTRSGMSGGPILEASSGKLIAINGRGQHPTLLFSNNSPYELSDGSVLPQAQQEIARFFSWGIPIQVYQNQARNINQNLPTIERKLQDGLLIGEGIRTDQLVKEETKEYQPRTYIFLVLILLVPLIASCYFLYSCYFLCKVQAEDLKETEIEPEQQETDYYSCVEPTSGAIIPSHQKSLLIIPYKEPSWEDKDLPIGEVILQLTKDGFLITKPIDYSNRYKISIINQDLYRERMKLGRIELEVRNYPRHFYCTGPYPNHQSEIWLIMLRHTMISKLKKQQPYFRPIPIKLTVSHY